MPTPPPPPAPPARTSAGAAARAVGIGLTVALITSALVAFAQDTPSLDAFRVGLCIAVSHAVAIGVPAAVVFTRLHPRLEAMAPVRRAAVIAIGLLVITLAGSAAAGALLVAAGLFEARAYASRFLPGAAMSFGIAALLGVGAFGYERLRDRLARAAAELHHGDLERLRAERLAADARLASLESRLRPHFLFNALNAALALVHDDPSGAERVLERLASLLRASLDAGGASLVALSREMETVTDYLEIERVRFGDRLRLALDVPAELGGVLVPPFSVQTLVENSVKHVVAARSAGASVSVGAMAEGARVTVTVTDDGPGFDNSAMAAGHGLDVLRGRLDALLPGRSALTIASPAGGGRGAAVSITVPRTEGAP